MKTFIALLLLALSAVQASAQTTEQNPLGALGGLLQKLGAKPGAQAAPPGAAADVPGMSRIKLLLEGDARLSGEIAGAMPVPGTVTPVNYLNAIDRYCREGLNRQLHDLKVATASQDRTRIGVGQALLMRRSGQCAQVGIAGGMEPGGRTVADWVEMTGFYLYEASSGDMYLQTVDATRERAKEYLRWAAANGGQQAERLLKEYLAAEPKPIERTGVAARVDAEDLYKLFEANRGLFYKTYEGKTVEVRGRIQLAGEDDLSIDTNPREKDPNKRGLSSFMMCTPKGAGKAKLLEVMKGGMVTVAGVIQRGGEFSPHQWRFEDCAIVATK